MEDKKDANGHPIAIQEFMGWLEESFATKYDQSLQGVKTRFLCIFSLFEHMLKGFIEISEYVI